ncbi:WhiB family transcriptional regulator [Actinopolymorpha sp. B11F2]|uniref:WhiB family transcriptional regulator n=1 Tax=Actinopolymorpha sp. B11F2 TaxID=3160862 RepID=UPI0032E4F5B1
MSRLPEIEALLPPGWWTADAACAQTDPEAFFPDVGGSSQGAKAVCRRCPVRAECLEHALTSGERFGVWGGLSEPERRRFKRTHAAELNARKGNAA